MFYCSTIKCSTEFIKILGVYISYTKNFKMKRISETSQKIFVRLQNFGT